MTNPCTCKAEHWQPHADACPVKVDRPLLTLDNIRSGAVPSDAVAVGYLLGEIEQLSEVIARCYMRMQCADVPREPWHWEVCTTLDNTGIPSALEPEADAQDALRWRFAVSAMCYSFDGENRTHYLKASGRETFAETIDRRLGTQKSSEELCQMAMTRDISGDTRSYACTREKGHSGFCHFADKLT